MFANVNRAVLIALGVLLALLALLILGIDQLLVLPFDLGVAFELHEDANPAFAALMADVSVLGMLPVAVGLTVIAAAGILFMRRRLEAAFTLATCSNFFVSSFLKLITARERPMFDLQNGAGFIQTFDSYSFPSGHVVFFMSLFGLLAYLAWRHLRGLPRWSAIGICALLIVLVGPSRVYLGVHWATDVVGGYLVGAIWLLILVYGYETAKRRPRR
ncbi:MAG: phosphatase PAP2 family protein [Dehalococcoidia bacterium]|nr:phosphatase PAP2 family protein [Dehalococcoidia bacterium]